MSEKINVLIGANIEGLKTALAESGRSLSDFGTIAQQAPKKAKTAIDELNTSYRNAVKDAKNLALTQGTTSDAFYEAQLKAKNLKNEIEGLNHVVGQTGQIAGGSGGVQQAAQKFNMLGNSLNQITRELPAFTYSMQTGFMAISNNIPMFVDQIGNIKKANAQLIAQGQPVKSVFSQLASAVLSWQTALSLGVTVLTVYGAEIVNLTRALFDNEEAIKRVQQNIDKMTITTANNAAGMKLWLDVYGQTLSGESLSLFQARENKEKRFQEIVKQSQAILLEEAKTGQKNIIGRNMVFGALLQNTKAYNKELTDISEKEKSRSKIQVKENIRFTLPTDEILPKSFVLPKLKVDVKKIDLLIDTTNAMSGFDNFKMQFLSTLDDIESRVGGWANVVGGMFTNAAAGFGAALVNNDFESYGKQLLGMLGDLAIQIGGALIAMGIPLAATGVPLGFTYLAAGAALAIVGGMLKAGSVPGQSKPNANNNQANNSMGGSGNVPTFNPTGMMISIDGMVRGNNIVVALDNQTRMNRRVR